MARQVHKGGGRPAGLLCSCAPVYRPPFPNKSTWCQAKITTFSQTVYLEVAGAVLLDAILPHSITEKYLCGHQNSFFGSSCAIPISPANMGEGTLFSHAWPDCLLWGMGGGGREKENQASEEQNALRCFKQCKGDSKNTGK